MTYRRRGGRWLFLLAIASQVAAGATLTLPIGLNPGDQYRIMFVTSTSRDATSTEISDYDLFVSQAANGPGSLLAGLTTTWQAIGSTETVQARDHIGAFSVPVFLVDGRRVVNDSEDLWDGDIGRPVELNEFGDRDEGDVWTGSTLLGFGSGFAGGRLGGLTPRHGVYGLADSEWVSSGNRYSFTEQLPLYGISGLLTVPAAPIPEPGTTVLTGLGAVALLLGRYRWRRN